MSDRTTAPMRGPPQLAEGHLLRPARPRLINEPRWILAFAAAATSAVIWRFGTAELLQWVGRFHPLIVHLPIGALIAGVLAEILLMATRRPSFDVAARYCLWVAAISAGAAVASGWFFGGFHVSDEQWIMTTHRWAGTGAGLCAVLALVLGEVSRRTGVARSRFWYRLALFTAVVVLGITGFFGGALIYGLDHYAW